MAVKARVEKADAKLVQNEKYQCELEQQRQELRTHLGTLTDKFKELSSEFILLSSLLCQPPTKLFL